MGKTKHLFLTCVSTVANEKGEERVNKALGNESFGVKRDEYGRSAEDYESMNMPVPKELLDSSSEIDEDGMIELKEDEIDYLFDDIILELSEFACAIDNQLTGTTTVYTKSNLSLTVEESTDEIFSQIYLLNQSWFDKCWESLKFRAKRIFKKNEKDLILEFPNKEE